MFSVTTKTKTNNANSATPSILATDLSIQGDLKSAGELLIEGHVTGDVTAKKVTTGPNSTIDGDVLAEELVVHGEIKGRVRAEHINLRATAKINGDVYHRTITIDAGAQVDGMYRHIENPREQQLPPKGGVLPLALAAPARKPAAGPAKA